MKKIFKYLFIIISVILVFINTGCNTKSVNDIMVPELIQAENVMFNHPDSALSILQSMSVPSPKKNKENNALWSLLVTQARYKLMMKISSDSLVRVAYDYYKTTNNTRGKAMSALYMGCVNYDLENIEEATQFYLEAKAEMEKTMDYKLGYLIMSGLGNIYLYRNLADYALEACNQAYDYAVKDSNKRYQMTSLRYLARCYYLRGDVEKCIHIYQSASKQALELNENDFYNALQLELAMVYANSQRFSQALIIAKELPFSSQKLLLMGQTYLSLNKVDSAYFYLKRALYTDNIYTKKSVYEVLYKLCEAPNYSQYTKICCDSLLLYKDSIMILDRSKEIISYKEKYDAEKLKAEKQRLELEKSDVTFWWMLTIVMVLFLVIIMIYIYLRKKLIIHKKEEELMSFALLLHEKELEIDKNQSYITELEKQYNKINQKEELYIEQSKIVENLKKDNEQLVLEKQLLYEKMSFYSVSSYEVTNIKILSDKLHMMEKREHELCLQLLAQSPVLHKLHMNPVYLNDTELKDICAISNDIFQNFSQRLLNAIPSLSDYEIVLCNLIKLRFSIPEISIFLNIASTSVSRSKHRIKNKIFSEFNINHKEKSLDVWLWEF